MGATLDHQSQVEYLMLTSVGINKPKSSTYQFPNGATQDGLFSFTALHQLLSESDRPDEILVLLTPEAEQYWPQIQSEANRVGAKVRRLSIAGNECPNDSETFLEKVARTIPADSRLLLDVTQGLRHHAFLFYALALYLSTFRGVDIRGAWYCRWEISRDDTVPRPFIDLKPALDLARWFHALAVFRETGSLRSLGALLLARQPKELVERFTDYFLNGMPIEAGDAAARLIAESNRQPLVQGLPLADALNTLLLEQINPLAGRTFEKQAKNKLPAKRSLPLDTEELERQARFISCYFSTRQFNLGFGLLREWLVNWLLCAGGNTTSWLEKPSREKIEHLLGGLDQVVKAKDPSDPKGETYLHAPVRETLSDVQKSWAKRWAEVCDIRNTLQHHGMKPQAFEFTRGDIDRAQKEFDQRSGWPGLDRFGGGHGRLLICPIGLTPGVLYSAILHTKPARVVVVCSKESAASVDEACNRAAFDGDVLRLIMQNIHRGVAEFEELKKQASLWLHQADEICANLTGGTSLMGVLISRLVARAGREYQRPVHEFVLIDHRSPEEQRKDPWKLGEIHYLDGGPVNEGDSRGEW